MHISSLPLFAALSALPTFAQPQLNLSSVDVGVWKSASPDYQADDNGTGVTVQKLNKGLPSIAPGCRVGKRGQVTRYEDMAQLQKMTPVSLNLTAWAVQIGPLNSSDVKSYQLWSLQTPIKTSPQLSTCFFPTFIPGRSPIRLNLCTQTPRERDAWLESLTEAVFCLHSGRYAPLLALDAGDEITDLPKESTRDDRWQRQMDTQISSMENNLTGNGSGNETKSTAKNGTVAAQIEIDNLQLGKPTTMVDGQPIPDDDSP